MDRKISPSPVNDNALLNLPLCSLDTLSWPQHIYLPIRGSRLGRRKHSVTFEAFQRLKRTSLFSTSLKASPFPSEMWLAGDGVTQWNIHEGENKYPNELPMSSRNRPSLHHQQSLSHRLGEIWLILYWIIFLHSFISTGSTDKLFDHKALLSAKSHFRVVMANDLASLLAGKSGSQHVFEARNAKDTARTEQNTMH